MTDKPKWTFEVLKLPQHIIDDMNESGAFYHKKKKETEKFIREHPWARMDEDEEDLIMDAEIVDYEMEKITDPINTMINREGRSHLVFQFRRGLLNIHAEENRDKPICLPIVPWDDPKKLIEEINTAIKNEGRSCLVFEFENGRLGVHEEKDGPVDERQSGGGGAEMMPREGSEDFRFRIQGTNGNVLCGPDLVRSDKFSRYGPQMRESFNLEFKFQE